MGRRRGTGIGAGHVASYTVAQTAGGIVGAVLANVMFDRLGGLIGLALVVALYPDAAASADDVVTPHRPDTDHVDQRSSS